MKKIKNITEYPFINYMLNWRMDFDNGYIDTEAKEEANKELKTAIDKLTNDPKTLFIISDLISTAMAQYENVGFLNGYLTAMEVMQGKLK